MPQETTGERLLAGRYRLLARVGHGGMGTVWQAHDEVLGRDVAVKEVILPHGLMDEERAVQYKRTFREARTAARLGHPGVVTVYDVVEEDGRPWIVMELILARSLDQVIKTEGPLPPHRAALIGRQMLAALHAAHEAGVLHRDVKPSNVLLAPGDRAVLTDFGIAVAQGDATLTQTGLVMGSPAYIAPERARGRTAGRASDLWSLGVTLYAMVDGRSPYERSEPMASLVAIISEDPPPPANAGPLAPVIDGLLRKDPDERMTAPEAGMLLDEIVQVRTADTERTQAVPIHFEETFEEAVEEPVHEDSGDPLATRVEASDAAVTEEVAAEQVPAEQARTDATRAEPRPGEATLRHSMSRRLAWRPGPGTEPSPTPETATRPVPEEGHGGGPRRPQVVIAAVTFLVVLALVVIVVNALASDDKPARRTGGNEPGTTRSSAPASPSPSKSASPTQSSPTRAAGGLPDGFRLYKDGTGFQIAVPDDWRGPEREGSSVFFRSPDRSAYIQIDQTDSPGDSAIADWRRQEEAAKSDGRFPGYQRIKLAATGDKPPVPDTGDGDKSADWEFTWQAGSGRMHGLDRGFVTNGHGYAVFVVGPDGEWDDLYDKTFLPAFESFKPADG